MREYELVYIVQPDLDETAFTGVMDRISGWITDAGGEVVKTDNWGKRNLAYPIRKLNEGNYVLLNIKILPSFCAELERNLRFLEPVMRFLLVLKDE